MLRHLATRIRKSRRVYEYTARYSREGLYEFLDEELEAMRDDGSPPEVLNIGAGGVIGQRIGEAQGIRSTSLDSDPDQQPDIVADVQAVNELFMNHFDAVFLMEVLEHIERPHVAISSIHEALKEGGSLIASVPFVFEVHAEPQDFYRYTNFGIEHLLHGFSEVRIARRTGYLKSLCVPLLRLYVSPSAFDTLVSFAFIMFFFLFRPLIEFIDRRITSTRSTTGYFVVAKK